jgi:6-phosphogluconate dehydrogenase (decarboxylating)
VQSLFTRFLSQKEDNFFLKVLALMRKEFGGHNIKHRGD